MLLIGPIILASEDATAALAARLAPRLARGDTLLLAGPVGAGKSAFARALIRARLGEPGAEVPSPTYTLVQTYGSGADTIWHVDLYRTEDAGEAAELGLFAAMEEAICLIEWPERLGPLMPASALRLDLTTATDEDGGTMSADERCASFSGSANWAMRLDGLDG